MDLGNKQLKRLYGPKKEQGNKKVIQIEFVIAVKKT
jgi:hypothetical protein